MADAGWWGVMTLFALVAVLAFFFILAATRMMNKEDQYSQWRKEMDAWRVAHPVWHFLMIIPLFGKFFFILHWLIGPPFPKRRENSEIEDLPNVEGYAPESKILVDE